MNYGHTLDSLLAWFSLLVSYTPRRVPEMRMFRTATSVILHRALTAELRTASDDTDERPLPEITGLLILRRLQKLDALRAQLRRSFLCCGYVLSSKALVYADTGAAADSTLHTSVTRLDGDQALLMGKHQEGSVF
jgi:hypothetical protein